jgi:hypothetical protein
MVDSEPSSPTNTSPQNQGQVQNRYGFYSPITREFYQIPSSYFQIFEQLFLQTQVTQEASQTETPQSNDE